MAGEMGKPDYEELDRAYMEGPSRSIDHCSSVIMTSSKWLNSARFRDVYAQEGLRKTGRDVPPTYMVQPDRDGDRRASARGRSAGAVRSRTRNQPGLRRVD